MVGGRVWWCDGREEVGGRIREATVFVVYSYECNIYIYICIYIVDTRVYMSILSVSIYVYIYYLTLICWCYSSSYVQCFETIDGHKGVTPTWLLDILDGEASLTMI